MNCYFFDVVLVDWQGHFYYFYFYYQVLAYIPLIGN